MNATIVKYGYPDTSIATYEHWVVLLNPKQGPTVPRLIVACREDGASLGAISAAAHVEFRTVAHDLERALDHSFRPDKLNWVLLMMVDPHVHFHVIPRFATPRTIAGQSVGDAGWPKHPDMGSILSFTPEELATVRQQLRAAWPVSLAGGE